MEFKREFPDDDACLEWLWRKRYSENGQTAWCPKCERQRRFHRLTAHPAYACDSCGHHIHPTARTIFHKSSTSLWLWFYAMFLMSSTRCGLSAKQLERQIGVTYKTAWRMLNLIRNELMCEDNEPLSGEVEADETYIGGKRHQAGTRGGRPGEDSGKVPVLGMVERGGSVKALTVPNAKADTLLPHIEERVLPATMIYTDELHSYKRLGSMGYGHRRIPHSEKIYVMGDVHTNTIEGFFGLLKNGIRGTHHAVSAKWLQSYLDEFAWRYNHRQDQTAMFRTLILTTVPG
jgi:transposase-like protein